MKMPTARSSDAGHTTNVLVVGVGGQGVVLISKMLARMCHVQGLEVKQSEVHGMAKRGGVVFSHVRFGHKVWSPTIPKGQADILVALEWEEGIRWLPYLNGETGTFIGDTQRIVPPIAFRDRRRDAVANYVDLAAEEIARKVPHCVAIDATGVAAALGNARAANTVLLGIVSTALEFSPEGWIPVLEEFAPRGTAKLNLQAFEAGRIRGAKPGEEQACGGDGAVRAPRQALGAAPHLPAARSPAPVERAAPPALEIDEAWCKGCDICVKVCPERCLGLNADGKAYLTNAAACTGCRVCEMLCPDFAIRIAG